MWPQPWTLPSSLTLPFPVPIVTLMLKVVIGGDTRYKNQPCNLALKRVRPNIREKPCWTNADPVRSGRVISVLVHLSHSQVGVRLCRVVSAALT